MLPFLEKVEKARDTITDTFGIRFGSWPVFIIGAVILLVAFLFSMNMVSLAMSIALFLTPLWLPVLLIGGAWALWVILIRSEFIFSQKMILLEIKPPRNIVKTPLAMEAFLSTLHLSGGESTWYQKWIKGSTRPFWSLEMASFGGQVHLYIYARARFRRIIESQMYAQYPGVQLIESVDYTRFANLDPKEWGVGIWGCDFKHEKPDPVPIKTYIEYGLDKVQKEPEQVDPLANLIEFMGSIGKGEYLWLQFVFRFHRCEKYHKKNKEGKTYTWKDQAKELVTKIREETRDKYTDPATGEEHAGFPNPTKGQIEKIAAIERNVSKLAFDVGIRGVYFAQEAFNSVAISNLNDLFKPFNTSEWNGIKSTGWMKRFDDYPWEIGVDTLKNHYRRKMIEAYRRRQFFYEPFSFGLSHDDIMVMSTEELATLFHIPSAAIAAPGLGRVPSATSEAPGNLPV
jgi:hypothetical protein